MKEFALQSVKRQKEIVRIMNVEYYTFIIRILKRQHHPDKQLLAINCQTTSIGLR